MVSKRLNSFVKTHGTNATVFVPRSRAEEDFVYDGPEWAIRLHSMFTNPENFKLTTLFNNMMFFA